MNQHHIDLSCGRSGSPSLFEVVEGLHKRSGNSDNLNLVKSVNDTIDVAVVLLNIELSCDVLCLLEDVLNLVGNVEDSALDRNSCVIHIEHKSIEN